jgi:N-acetylglucosamine kinase-like BadF-type ATPase
VTGYGPWFGEYGGASELVVRAIQAITFEWARRGPATRLTQKFMELTGAKTAAELVEGLTAEIYPIGAHTARAVFEVAAAGDPVAIECIRWIGEQLGDMANGVIRQLNFEAEDFEVVLVGSLYEGGPLLIEPMRQTVLAVAPKARFVRLSAPPVIGGVLLGMEMGGVNGWKVKERLIETTNALIRNKTADERG